MTSISIGAEIWSILKAVLAGVISKKLIEKNQNHLSTHEISRYQDSPDESCEEINTRKKLVLRLNDALKALNGKQNCPKYTIETIAIKMNSNTLSEIESYFNGDKEPEIKWLKKFANTFHLNKNWILKGENEVFSNNLIPFRRDTEKTLLEIRQFNPDKVIFVKEDSHHSECNIVLIKSDGNFKIIERNGNWKMSKETGGTGRRDTFYYYKIIQSILNDEKLFYRSSGTIISESDFKKLNEGYINPCNFFDRQNILWFEDLSDFQHENNNAEYYTKWYGNTFIDAQTIIHSELNCEIEKKTSLKLEKID